MLRGRTMKRLMPVFFCMTVFFTTAFAEDFPVEQDYYADDEFMFEEEELLTETADVLFFDEEVWETEPEPEPAAEEPAEGLFEETGLFFEEEVTSDSVTFEPQNGIPLVIIRIREQELTEEDGDMYGSVADMNGSRDHSVRCHGTVEILVPDGFVSEYGSGAVPEGEIDLKYIRGRGNSTWTKKKKPYKLKFEKKQELFGMPRNKEWALLANSVDNTLIKNRVIGWLGDRMGLKNTPRMVPVDVVMIGDKSGTTFLGSYCLSELVEVASGRVDIAGLSPENADLEGGNNITGGYLLSMYNRGQDGDVPKNSVFTTEAGVTLINDTPEYGDGTLTEGEEAQRSYIRSYIRDLEELIVNGETIDRETHERIAAMTDMKSLADYWLIQVFSRNGDAFRTSSTYLYKERDGKLYWGPLWDFDRALYGSGADPSGNKRLAGFDHVRMVWIDALRDKDPRFVELLKEEWELMDSEIESLIRDGGVIDGYASRLAASKAADNDIWKKHDDYGLIISNLKKWIGLRRDWINGNIDLIGGVFLTVSFEAGGTCIGSDFCSPGEMLSEGPEAPYREGYRFTGWFEAETHAPLEGYAVNRDTVFVAEYEESETEPATEPTPEPTPEPATEPTSEPTSEPATERTPEPVPDPTPAAAVQKMAQPLSVTAKNPSVKASKLKKKKQTIAAKKVFTITNAQGTVSYKKLSGNKKITVNAKTGKITVKKGLKKGTHKVRIQITAAGNDIYEAGSKTVTVKIRVK